MTTLKHAHTLLLGSSWLLPVPSTENSNDGTRFFWRYGHKIATDELKRLLQNGFQECYKHIYSGWRNCIVAQWDCFEGKVAWMIAIFYNSRKWNDSGNILKLPHTIQDLNSGFSPQTTYSSTTNIACCFVCVSNLVSAPKIMIPTEAI
jgi:hypothetical protein